MNDNREPEYKKDLVLALIGFVLAFVVPPVCVVLALWTEPGWRWFWTGVVSFVVGIACGQLSLVLDRKYRERGIRK